MGEIFFRLHTVVANQTGKKISSAPLRGFREKKRSHNPGTVPNETIAQRNSKKKLDIIRYVYWIYPAVVKQMNRQPFHPNTPGGGFG